MDNRSQTTETQQLRFTNVNELAGHVNTAMRDNRDLDFFVVTHVSAEDANRIYNERDRRGLGWRLAYKGRTARQLLVTVPTGRHEAAQVALNHEIMSAIETQANMKGRWTPLGARRYKGRDEDEDSWREGDASGVPKDPTVMYNWPTLVIECGYSQSLPSLRNAMQWWFAESGREVQIVLLIKLYPSTRTMLVEKYTEERPVPGARPGATMTRQAAAAAFIPTLRQIITIKEIPGTRRRPRLAPRQNDFTSNLLGAEYDVDSDNLVLEFERLFLVHADANRGQRDIVIPPSELVSIADAVWGLEN